ncbi:MAG: hypothetical protein PHP34_05820, partial [Bacteroidales bacterium]|nr:hypothetical protein [Bacteroidales bacterium]
MKQILYILTVLFFAGCGNKGPGNSQMYGVKPDSSMHIMYAEGFSVDYYQNFKRVTLSDPWKPGAVFARYYLVEDSIVQT